MYEDQRDVAKLKAAEARMEELGVFDKAGAHKTNWNRMRAIPYLAKPRSGCGWPNCKKSKTDKSHTIARTSGLGLIERNYHVYMPDFTKYPIEVSEYGWKQATVFDGYCGEHEKYFTFEQNGILKSTSDVALQLFRSTAREYANKRQRFAPIRAKLDEYVEILEKNPVKAVPADLVNDVTVSLEDILLRMDDEANQLWRLWGACFSLTDFSTYAESETPSSKILRRMSVQTSRRIALSGSTFIHTKNHAGEEHPTRVPVVVTMLPTQNGVDLLFVTTHEDWADQYEANLHKIIRTEGSDELVDNWLEFSDWWCSDPEWWDSMDTAWQQRILTSLGTL